MKLLNVLVNFLKNKNYLVISKKFLSRFEKDQTKLALDWTKNQVKYSVHEWMQKTDFKLYLETKKECEIIRNYADANAGTIDYTTGTIKISSINITKISNVDGLVSTKIRITAIPNSKDVAPILNQILEIDMINTSIDGEIDTIAVSAAGGTSNYTTYSSTPTTTSSY